MNLNEVKIVGNLTREPELCRTSQGASIVDISLGVNEVYANGEGKKHDVTTFVDVQVWGKSAEALAKHVKKGEQVFVSGPLRQSTWKDPETGKNRSKLFVKAESWQFVQYKATEAQREAARAQSQGVER
jgi:single-strand DNA-binding protein